MLLYFSVLLHRRWMPQSREVVKFVLPNLHEINKHLRSVINPRIDMLTNQRLYLNFITNYNQLHLAHRQRQWLETSIIPSHHQSPCCLSPIGSTSGSSL